MLTRRDMLRNIGSGFGMLGFAGVAAEAAAIDPLAPKTPHFPARAKHVIFLFLNGGPSQVDTFDPKPMLTKYDGQPYPGEKLKTERVTGNLMRSPFSFRKCGQSGIEVSEIFPRVGEMIDEMCLVRSMYTDQPFHNQSFLMMNCGQRLPGFPALGAWLGYGLGTENRSLPGFMVLSPGFPTVGPELWGAGFLPGLYGGTYIQNSSLDPERLVPNVHNKRYSLPEQREQLDLLGKLNQWQLDREGPDVQLESRIHSMEIAYRMQTEATDALDISKETEATRKLYGIGSGMPPFHPYPGTGGYIHPDNFASGCLMARRLVERGVRMVQVYYGPGQPWDTHMDITIHRKLAMAADAPIAGLLRDLKSRGLLKDTLVVIGGEFGRTPVMETSARERVQQGRDHNSHGFTMVLAGGGAKPGFAYGATDDFGFKAVEKPVHVHDLHATILHLMGLDHKRLTFRFSGRDYRLTDVEGNVIHDIIA